jgi:RNA polymerase sigma-70 factor, ECF subfamily
MSVQPSIDLVELYQLHAVRLRAWAKKRGIPSSECEDVVQDIFLQAYRGRASFRGESTSMSWLFRIAKRVAAKSWRKHGLRVARASSDAGLEEIPADGLSPLEGAELHEFAAMLDRALEAAGAERRTLILGNALGQSPFDAQACDDAPKAGTRWVRLHRARKRVMAILARNRVEPLLPYSFTGSDRQAAAEIRSGSGVAPALRCCRG